ncbi:hypothetical protein EW093_09530 [Thiospirochaeta perfilievii]|uniref:NfeD-like C-terminal domain-containing protein n=1 Tax=Thiospirochaeta perfilievii TaxID=252967 RepID=A0A5C1QC75_9SPIO|nr:NfeD family protein [Thiospirochaeta perfilievii]QEN04938.1 hypothetical protein EW093_09530 [Thiospirochaeta perfilievii]
MILLYNIIFVILGFLIIIIEFFVPSAGLIGVIGFGLVVTGIVRSFLTYGIITGTIFLFSSLVIGPILFYLYFKLFPKSSIGKKLILHNNFSKSKGYIPTVEEDSNLLGLTGRALTNLRPIGEAQLDNKKYNVTTQGEYINKNSYIKVISIKGKTVVVALEEIL